MGRQGTQKTGCDEISKFLEKLTNPVDYFSGAKLGDAVLADNIIIYKRMSASMLRPRGVTHNYHHRHALVIPLEKSGVIHTSGSSCHLSPGVVCLFFPHQFHHFLDIEEDAMKWLFITFQSRNGETLAPLRNSPRRIGAREMNDLGEMLGEYVSLPPGAERSLNLIPRFSRFLRRLLSCREAVGAIESGSPGGDLRGTILERINAYVRSHLAQPVTIPSLARHMGYSESYMRAIFRRELGVSLGAYMRESRLSVAASMLAEQDRDSVEEIARACGFKSIFVFSRAFKKAMGVSPRAYGKSVHSPGRRR